MLNSSYWRPPEFALRLERTAICKSNTATPLLEPQYQYDAVITHGSFRVDGASMPTSPALRIREISSGALAQDFNSRRFYSNPQSGWIPVNGVEYPLHIMFANDTAPGINWAPLIVPAGCFLEYRRESGGSSVTLVTCKFLGYLTPVGTLFPAVGIP